LAEPRKRNLKATHTPFRIAPKNEEVGGVGELGGEETGVDIYWEVDWEVGGMES